MAKNNENRNKRSQSVGQQLNQLEDQANQRKQKGSTNQIQPETTDEGWTQ